MNGRHPVSSHLPALDFLGRYEPNAWVKSLHPTVSPCCMKHDHPADPDPRSGHRTASPPPPMQHPSPPPLKRQVQTQSPDLTQFKKEQPVGKRCRVRVKPRWGMILDIHRRHCVQSIADIVSRFLRPATDKVGSIHMVKCNDSLCRFVFLEEAFTLVISQWSRIGSFCAEIAPCYPW